MKFGNNPKDRLGSKKVSISKVPPTAIVFLATAMQNGSEKYGPYNWRQNKVIASIYVDAMYRHIMAWWDGEEIAADSGVHHLGHAMANGAILADAMSTGNLIDDRPLKGRAAEMLKKLEKQNESRLPKSKQRT